MGQWKCEAPSCSSKACFHWGSCYYCGGHYCAHHVEDPAFHQCSRPETRTENLMLSFKRNTVLDMIEKLDMDHIAAEAASLRPGYTCMAPERAKLTRSYWTDNTEFIAHGTNVHIPLTFDDGVKWMVRIRQPRQQSPIPPAVKMNLLSDAAAFRVLHDNGVKVPQAYLRPEHSPDICYEYFYTEFVDGLTFDPFLGSIPFADFNRSPVPRKLAPQVLYEVAQWYISLEKVTFPAVGSPTFDEHGAIIVGPIIDRMTLQDDFPFYLGPFTTPLERYVNFFGTILQHILSGRWCAPDAEIQSYLEILEAKKLVEADKDMSQDTGPWYLKHGDPRGDHIRVTMEGQLTAVLDWDWAFITSKADAFAAPHAWTHPVLLYQGDTNLSKLEVEFAEVYDNLGRRDLGNLVRNGKKYQYLNMMTTRFLHYCKELNALRRAFLNLPPDSRDGEPKNMAEWLLAARERYRGDEGLETLMAKHCNALPTRVRVDGVHLRDANELDPPPEKLWTPENYPQHFRDQDEAD